MERSLEDVLGLVHLSKLDEKDLTKTTQCIYLGDPITTEGTVLIEANDVLLQHIETEQRIFLRGDDGDSAILCTKSDCYDVKTAETSNSILLFPQLNINNDSTEINQESRGLVSTKVCGLFHHYLEIKKCKPKLKKLRLVLEENPFQGCEYEGDNVGKKYTYQDLLNCIQASEEELKQELKTVMAIQIEGHWRILDFDYLCRIVNFILGVIDSNSIPLDNIPKDVILQELEDLEPRVIVDQILDMYMEPIEENKNLVKLKEKEVCQYFAQVLLRRVEKFHLEEFLESWQRSVPEGITTNLSQLSGLALTDLTSKPKSIFYYPVSLLPEEVNERLTALFKIKEKWTFEDIKPYIEDLTSQTLNVGGLLTKYARTSLLKGVKFYSAKHPSI